MIRIACVCAGMIVLLLLTSGDQSVANDDDGLLTSLREKDRIVGQLYLESTQVVPVEWTKSHPRRERVKFTRRDAMHAVEVELDEVLTCGRPLPATSGGRGISGPRSVPLERCYLFDAERSASRMVSALQQDNAGVPNKTGTTQVFQHVYAPDDASETLFIYLPKWLLGRGFSEHLTSLKLNRTGDDGLLHASGSGFFVPELTGTWHLVMDPKQVMLVRQAEFFRDKEVRPMLRVRTSGLLTPDVPTDGSIVFAAVGHYIQFYGTKESSVDVENHRVSLKMNEPFFKAVRDKFDKAPPVHSILIDSRGKQDVPSE